MEITKENLKKIKELIFDENISLEERINILNKIEEEISKILLEFEKESEPIDE